MTSPTKTKFPHPKDNKNNMDSKYSNIKTKQGHNNIMQPRDKSGGK